MSKKLPVSGFRWVENTFQSSKDFIENTLKLEMKDIFLKFMFKKRKSYTEKLHGLHNDLLFLPEKLKIEKVEKFVSSKRML